MNYKTNYLLRNAAGLIAVACLTVSANASVSRRSGCDHHLYVESNASSNNCVLVYNIKPDGSLEYETSVSTGGSGNGAGLGQGALAFGEHGKLLYAVNAGSNTISVFKVDFHGLCLLQTIGSGGTTPLSVTAHEDVAYVLNAGAVNNITGFKWHYGRGLTPIQGSTRLLSSASPTPEQIGFSPSGAKLVVSEKLTQKIDVFPVDDYGMVGKRNTFESVGVWPFGFGFGHHGTLVMSEADAGMANASSASTYHLDQKASISIVSGSVGTNHTAACWMIVTHDGRFAFAADAGSAAITGYKLDEFGALSLQNPTGFNAATDAHPVDMAVSLDDSFLYVVANNGGAIDEFEIGPDGSLAPISSITGLPVSISGAVSN